MSMCDNTVLRAPTDTPADSYRTRPASGGGSMSGGRVGRGGRGCWGSGAGGSRSGLRSGVSARLPVDVGRHRAPEKPTSARSRVSQLTDDRDDISRDLQHACAGTTNELSDGLGAV